MDPLEQEDEAPAPVPRAPSPSYARGEPWDFIEVDEEMEYDWMPLSLLGQIILPMPTAAAGPTEDE